MAINRINNAIMDALEQPPPPIGETRCVCHATEAEWTAFVNSEDHVIMKPNYLVWFEDLQQIHIVEFDSTAHEVFIFRLNSFMLADPNISQWLVPRGASTNSQGRRLQPDLSFGPARTTSNAVLTPGVPIWDDFKSIKVEIGMS